MVAPAVAGDTALIQPPMRATLRWLGPLLVLSAAACQRNGHDAPRTTSKLYGTMLNGLLKETVPFVSVAQLKARPGAVLLDARGPNEFAVSHLAGARWVGYDDFSLARVQGLPKDAPIVVYCSVGFRSEKVGEQLQRAGYTHVQNLYGGLFEWVNEGNPTVAPDGAPTARVHGYSRTWGIWLRRGQPVYN